MPHPFPISSATHPLNGKDAARATLSADSGRTAPHAARQSSAHAIRDRVHRPRAVILEQDPSILAVLGEILGDEDYDVLLSTRFLEKDEVTRLEPDVIIADTTFNRGPDGHCLYSEPPQRSDGTSIPVVYSTTRPDIAARLADRHVPILLKPFDLDVLLALVSQADT